MLQSSTGDAISLFQFIAHVTRMTSMRLIEAIFAESFASHGKEGRRNGVSISPADQKSGTVCYERRLLQSRHDACIEHSVFLPSHGEICAGELTRQACEVTMKSHAKRINSG